MNPFAAIRPIQNLAGAVFFVQPLHDENSPRRFKVSMTEDWEHPDQHLRRMRPVFDSLIERLGVRSLCAGQSARKPFPSRRPAKAFASSAAVAGALIEHPQIL